MDILPIIPLKLDIYDYDKYEKWPFLVVLSYMPCFCAYLYFYNHGYDYMTKSLHGYEYMTKNLLHEHHIIF